MPARGSERKRIVLAGEDRTHRLLGSRLFTLVVTEVAGECPGVFVGLEPGSEFYDTRHSKEDAKKAGLRTTGRLLGELRSPASVLLVRTWLLAARARADALILIADSDNDGELLRDAERVQTASLSAPMAAIGVAHRDAEGWLLAGYSAQSQLEQVRLFEANKLLSFDVTRQPHRLTAQPNEAVTDAKRVLAYVLGEGRGLSGKGRASSRPPTEDELEFLVPGLATLEALAAFQECGVAAFIVSLRRVVEALHPPIG